MPILLRAIALALLLPVLQGCASSYQQMGFTGGFEEREIRAGVWGIAYAGNGFTSYETVQAYWLYRAAEFTLQKGYDGFEIISVMNLSSADTGRRLREVQYYTNRDNKPTLYGEIRLLKKPVQADPPRIFNAAALKAALELRVKQLCGSNVCPHVHDYLMPPLKSLL